VTATATVPEATDEHYALVDAAYAKITQGWYIGDMETLRLYGFGTEIPSRTNPEEVWVALRFTRDRMHHSVGWWRNAEYEYCYHLSISAREATAMRMLRAGIEPPTGAQGFVSIPDDEEKYWGRLFYREHANKVWHEPGGTDPRYTREEKLRFRHLLHLRLFLDPETFQPFIPTGEVYDLTRWIPGLTPEKVDR
jgi:hypothetical protein